jgi:hypothetical protein
VADDQGLVEELGSSIGRGTGAYERTLHLVCGDATARLRDGTRTLADGITDKLEPA